MANRYWVGGSGTWNTTSTTNWSTSPGGGAGASVPTAADDVFFDQAGTYTVTCTGALTCLDLTVSAGTVSFVNGTSPTFAISGSFTLLAGTVWTTTGGITFNSSTTGRTITTNGVPISSQMSFNNATGGWTLGSALTLPTAGQLTAFSAGAFDTAGYALTLTTFFSGTTSVRSINLRSSTVTCTGVGFSINSATNLTFDAGTSTINFSFSNFSFTLPTTGLTFYNLTRLVSAGTANIYCTISSGPITCNNFTISRPSESNGSTSELKLEQDLTVTGTLTFGAATTANYRIVVASNITGVQRTISAANVSTITDVDFCDIIAAGASSPWSGTNLGDGTNNSGISFAAAKTVYWNSTALYWASTGWATSSGGVPANANFPLAQDTAVFDNTGSTPAVMTIFGDYLLPTINIQRTSAFQLDTSGSSILARVYGNITLQAATTLGRSGTNFTIAANGKSTTITQNSGTILGNITVNCGTGTFALSANITITPSVGAGTLFVNSGTFSLSGYVLSAGGINFNGNSNAGYGTAIIAFGSSYLEATGVGTIFQGAFAGKACTITGTPLIICTNSSATARTISTDAPTEANSVSFRITAGTGTLTFTGFCRDLDFTDGVNPTGFAGTLSNNGLTAYGNFKASTGMTFAAGPAAMSFAATSGTKTIDTAGVTLDFPLTFNGVGGTFQLVSALTSGATRLCTLTNGTLDLNGYTLTTGSFGSSNSNVRTLAFGTSNIVVTGVNTSIFTASSVTNLTITGVPVVDCTGTTGTSGQTRNFSIGAFSESQAINVNINPGTSAVDIFRLGFTSGSFKNVVFSNTFTGTVQVLNTIFIYGNLNLGGVTAITGSSEITFAATSGIKTIRTNGQTFSTGVTFSGLGGTWEMQDALAISGTLSFANGTLRLKAGTTNTVGAFVTSGTVRKYLESTVPGTQATISDASGTNAASYLSVQDSNATGGATWTALFSSNNVYAGNNTGWLFNVLYTRAVIETASATETNVPQRRISRAITETATQTDVTNRAAFFTGSISEAASGTDSVGATGTLKGAITETASGVDTPSATREGGVNIAEQATSTDLVASKAEFYSNVAETATETDTTNRVLIVSTNIAETATETDSVVPSLRMTRAIAETSTGTDSVVPSLRINRSITETATGTQTNNVQMSAAATIAETSTGTDIVDRGLFVTGNIAETATQTDSITPQYRFAGPISETTSVTLVQSSGFNLVAFVAETSTGTDTIGPSLSISRAISETATQTDTVVPSLRMTRAVTETATGTDAVVPSLRMTRAVTETATATQTNTGLYTAAPTVTETTLASDSNNGVRTTATSVTETTDVTDSPESNFLWTRIDDSQDPNWIPVNNS